MEYDVKEKVREHYAGIAKNVDQGCSCSCGYADISNSSVIYKDMDLNNLPASAVKASLGCANPLVLANLKEGETVLDLGSGGGIDCLMSSKFVGKTGKIYGLDMTDEMLALATKNKAEMGVTNVEFIKGYLENIPLEDNSIDVVISNCVINLSESKEKALAEAYRVLKQGGRLAIADIVTLRNVPYDLKKAAELWVGCIAGSLLIDQYKQILQDSGFKNIDIEPVHIYSREVIESMIDIKKLLEANLTAQDWTNIDGAFAGAFVKAIK